jgi:hypothetical protein
MRIPQKFQIDWLQNPAGSGNTGDLFFEILFLL